MSQGIMEKNLPVAESIQSGDKIRIVTSAGNSKQIDPSSIGGDDVFKFTVTAVFDSEGEYATSFTCDKTPAEICGARDDGKLLAMTLISDYTTSDDEVYTSTFVVDVNGDANDCFIDFNHIRHESNNVCVGSSSITISTDSTKDKYNEWVAYIEPTERHTYYPNN